LDLVQENKSQSVLKWGEWKREEGKENVGKEEKEMKVCFFDCDLTGVPKIN